MTSDAATRRRLARQRERRRLVRLHRYERAAHERGFALVGGMDEVGRGPLAGPVVAACIVADGPLMLRGLDDSKRVAPERRCELAVQIRERAIAWAIGSASVAEIERLNIYWATMLAMERALAGLAPQPHYLLTDAVRVRAFGGEQLPVIKGDAKCATVAAASIVAKVHRDALLVELDREHPQYGFAEHKGYATARHIAALQEHGPCPHHRRGFWRVAAALSLFALDDRGDAGTAAP
ncbi:MAG: ribonuclease HII [Candidatus Eremiobacteraeota bacterium]|nr:ribonuclease HII [Candidatus Eremiobacteraeota bacterium]MBC5803046.1 ribonuclease HII [Candidatus Eremiobacteraeota bacterium]MBC5821415.1 ribonuclease HII [Candidatus Eremiobacteraeota bacterium]